MFLQIIYLVYMYKLDLTLNNLKWLICHKTQTNQARGSGHIDQVQILDEAVGISHTANTLEKGMNATILLPAMGK